MIQRLGLLLFILLMRFYNLGIRPSHHDEAVNGWFVDGIWSKGFYHYDPANYHGPIFFYIITFFEWIFGRSIEVLRAPTVLFGMAICFTPLLFKRWITDRGAWLAAFFLAVSPACVFYSRYTIHETAFTLVCILFLYFWLRARSEGLTSNLIIGLGSMLGLMAGLKENFILFIACVIIAEGVLELMPKLLPAVGANHPQFKMFESGDFKKGAIAILSILGIAFLIIALSYSAFGRDGEGIANFFRAFSFWSDTGSKGNGHQKPFYYWLNILISYEWFAFIGLVLTPLALMKTSAEIRLISIMSFGLFMAYSLVSYKTPWCVLSFYWGLIFVSAYWISKWSTKNGYKWPIFGAFLIGLGFSAYQSYDVAYDNVDSDRHPYIYGQTYRSFMIPVDQILAKLKQNPDLKNTLRIQIISEFTWPLPWLLGEFKQVGYHTIQNPPAVLDGDYLLIDTKIEGSYQGIIKDKEKYTRTEYRARQWASPMAFYERH